MSRIKTIEELTKEFNSKLKNIGYTRVSFTSVEKKFLKYCFEHVRGETLKEAADFVNNPFDKNNVLALNDSENLEIK